MIDGIEAFYSQIADSMTEGIPEEWTTASFEAIFFSDSSIYEAEYTRLSDGKTRSFLTVNGDRVFRQLRKKFKDAGKPLWGKARFELRSDGTFNMNWTYEDCDLEGNTNYDEEAELQRHEARQIRLTQS